MLIDIITGLLMNAPALIFYGIGLFSCKKLKGCMGFYWFGTLILQALPLFGGISGMIRNPSVWVNISQITYVFSAPVISVLFYFIMKKSSTASYPPAIPADKPTDGSIIENSVSDSPVKPKKPIFERYDTYITCPGCGSLVPKGIKRCECGYDLSGPAVRLGRRIRRAVPILLCLLFIIVGTSIGYYAGQRSMNPELEEQYNLGYKSGHDAGSESGYSDGYNRGIELGAKRAARDLENCYMDGYRSAMRDVGISSSNDIFSGFYTYFDGRSKLHSDLAQKYGVNPVRSKQEVMELLNESSSPEMPILSGSK